MRSDLDSQVYEIQDYFAVHHIHDRSPRPFISMGFGLLVCRPSSICAKHNAAPRPGNIPTGVTAKHGRLQLSMYLGPL
jgi:hypothetical protein